VLAAELRPVDSSDQVRLSRSSWRTIYTRGGYYGESVAVFTIDDPGLYLLNVEDPTDFRINGVAIGREPESAMAVRMLLGLGAAFVLLVAESRMPWPFALSPPRYQARPTAMRSQLPLPTCARAAACSTVRQGDG